MSNNKKQILKALRKIDSLCGTLSVEGEPQAAYDIRLILIKLYEKYTREDKQLFYEKLKKGTQ